MSKVYTFFPHGLKLPFLRHDRSVRQVTGEFWVWVWWRFLFGARCFTMYTNFKLVNLCVSLFSIDMWGLCIVVVGHFIQISYMVNMRFAIVAPSKSYKDITNLIGFVPNLLFDVCSQILHPNRGFVSVETIPSCSATSCSGDCETPLHPGERHHLNTIYFLSWSVFFQITSFGHVSKSLDIFVVYFE